MGKRVDPENESLFAVGGVFTEHSRPFRRPLWQPGGQTQRPTAVLERRVVGAVRRDEGDVDAEVACGVVQGGEERRDDLAAPQAVAAVARPDDGKRDEWDVATGFLGGGAQSVA